MIPLQQRAEGPPEVGLGRRRRDRATPWFTILAFLFVTFNSGMAIYRSAGDFTSIAFVAFSYVDLVMLFAYLRWYERAPAGTTTESLRDRIRSAVWMLTTLLTGMFSCKVAAVMPLPAAVLVWAMAGAAALGFYAFFVHQEEVGILGRSRAPLPL